MHYWQVVDHCYAVCKLRLTMPSRLGFSRAAATRSLSFSCLFTAASVECAPGVMKMSTCACTSDASHRHERSGRLQTQGNTLLGCHVLHTQCHDLAVIQIRIVM